MNNKIATLLLPIAIIIIAVSVAAAWDDKVTHPDLSQSAAEQSIIGNTDYLVKLGIDKKLKQLLGLAGNHKMVFEFIRDGAQLEDAGTDWDGVKGIARYNNHFHNPTKIWDTAGLNDLSKSSGESALLWAQDGKRQTAVVGGDWSWARIRALYFLALTSVRDDPDRQKYFAQMFQGLGYQMHLIQDMAVPTHVRNDAHPLDAKRGFDPRFGSLYFETWARRNYSKINTFATNPKFPTVSLTVSRYNLVPITQLFDTTANLATTRSVGLDIGLAEYANANFFSDDTIFSAETYTLDHKHYSPYPRESSTNLQLYVDKGILGSHGIFPEAILGTDGVPGISFWIEKDKEGENVRHFVKPGYFTDDVNETAGAANKVYLRTFYLDEQCHNDYAELLVPRAVGYSAALINYFFRGQINLTPDTDDPTQFVISNDSDENMHGIFSLYHDDKSGNRTLVKASLISSGVSTIEANSDSDPISIDEIASFGTGTYTLVFRGTMGSEVGAVAGRVLTLTSLEITSPSQYAYGVIDGSASPQQFTKIKAKVHNTSDSAIKEGTIQATAKYKLRPAYRSDMSLDPPGDMTNVSYIYSKSALQSVSSIKKLESTEFTFDFSANPIPAGITDLYLSVAFTGTIGDSPDQVAIGMKDITEPTHHTYWNLSDRFTLDGSLYTAADILADETLLKKLRSYDVAETSVEPYPLTMNIAYFDDASQINDVAGAAALQPGGYMRLISLFDKKNGNYARISFVSPEFPQGRDYGADFHGAVNQTVAGRTFRASALSFRTIKSHFNMGILSCAPSKNAAECLYPGGESLAPVNAVPQRIRIQY